MKTILRKICNSLQVFVRGVYYVLFSLIGGDLAKVENNRNDKILIIGNGPSLKEIELKNFRDNYIYACVNFFALKEKIFWELKPAFYFLTDPAFFQKENRKDLDKKRDDLIALFEKVTWPMKIITLQGNRFDINNENIAYDYLSKFSMQYKDDTLSGFVRLLHKNNRVTCGGQNVICSAIYYCVLKHFSEVLVAGVDMSEFKVFSINENNHVIAKYEHFYGNDEIDETESGEIPIGRFGVYLSYYAKMLMEFITLSEFARTEKVKVYNLSLNSYIDVFEKKDWHEFV